MVTGESVPQTLAVAWGLSPHKTSLSPHRETDWSKLVCQLLISHFEISSFPQSKSVNDVYKLLQLLGIKSPRATALNMKIAALPPMVEAKMEANKAKERVRRICADDKYE